MARGIKTKKPGKTLIPQKEEKTSLKSLKKDLIEQLKLGESYVSLILGALVVTVIFLVFLVFLLGNYKKGIINTNTPPQIPTPSKAASKQINYTLQEGESLWDVAVKFYGDGFRYTEIIEANALENPDFVPPGTELIIPNTK